jgi:hypothetical protein
MKRSILACTLLASTWAHAVNGNLLHEYCSSDKDSFYRRAYCDGYAVGVTELANASSGKAFCIPSEVTQGQVTDIVKRYLNAHPEQRHLDAWVLVLYALRESFPCR